MSPEDARPTAADAPVGGLYREIIETLEEGVYFVDRERRIRYWNDGARRISGFAARDVVGRQCFDDILNHVDETGDVLCLTGCPLAATMEDGEPREAFIYLRHRDGHRVPVRVRACAVRNAEGEIVGAAESFHDASPAHHAAHEAEELRRLAFVDDTTGLPNRRASEQAIAARLDSLARHGWSFGLLVVDVDRFKQINDRFGHNAGDRALRLIAVTIANAARAEDFVGRWGGDEFVVLVSAADAAALAGTARRIRALVARCRLTVAEHATPVSVTIGAAVALPTDSAESLFERADQALYGSKPGAAPER